MSSASTADATLGALASSTVPALTSSTAPALGSFSAPALGVSSAPALGAFTAPALGAFSAPTLGISTAGAFGVSTAATFGLSTVPVLGASTISALDHTSLGAAATTPFGSLFSSGASSSSSMVPSASTPFQFGHLLTVKLGQDNYLFWRAQILPLLRSHYLTGFIDGSYPCPPERISVLAEGGRVVTVLNPEHRAWVQQDQAILSAIVSSSTPAVSGLILFATSAQEAWTAYSSSFGSQSTARAMQIRTQLSQIKKLDLTATAFFNQVKSLADTLTSIGQPLRDEEFAGYVLNGLDADYDNLVENVNGRDTPISPRELYARILSTEQRVESRRAALNIAESSANAASRNGGRGYGNRPSQGGGGQNSRSTYSPRPSNPTPPLSNNFGNGNGGANGGRNGGGQRRNDGNRNDGNRPLCQLCNTLGHVASKCFKRFNQAYLGVGNDGSQTERQIALGTQGQVQGRAQANSVDTSWYMDTGATDHLTGDLDKLAMKEPYHGHDQVHTANGSGSRFEGNSA